MVEQRGGVDPAGAAGRPILIPLCRFRAKPGGVRGSEPRFMQHRTADRNRISIAVRTRFSWPWVHSGGVGFGVRHPSLPGTSIVRAESERLQGSTDQVNTRTQARFPPSERPRCPSRQALPAGWWCLRPVPPARSSSSRESLRSACRPRTAARGQSSVRGG